MLKVSREARPLLTEETDNLTWVSLTEKSNGRTGLRTSTTKKMLLPLRLKPDPHTDPGP